MPKFSECWRCGKTNTNQTCRNCSVAKYCNVTCLEQDIYRHDAECRPVHLYRTCSSCRQISRNTLACTSCYRTFYCNASCEKSDQKEHKRDCKRVEESIKSLANELSPFFSVSASVCPVNYYWGNVPAYDCLNLAENEGCDYNAEMNVLCLAVGDLRNVLLTCASLPESCTSRIKFTLNDIDECIMARSVLQLYMLIKCDSRVEKPFTEIWYSTTLSERTYNYLCASLKGLLAVRDSKRLNAVTDGLIRVNDNDLKKLKTVWRKWLKLKVQGTSWIREQRRNSMTKDPLSATGQFSYLNCIPREHYSSAKLWMDEGSFSRTETAVFAENPTLTGPKMVNWAGANVATEDDPYVHSSPVASGVIPFTGWDYVEVKKCTHDESLVSMYGQHIESKLRRVAGKLFSKQISFKVVLGDCMKIGDSLGTEVKYDRITTSNMMDYVPLPDLLRLYSEKLNRENPYATLMTETINWIRFCRDADISGKESQELRNVALRDTGSKVIANDWGTSFREYFDNSHHFRDYLRAIFYAYRLRQSSGRSSRLPCLNELGSEFDLRLRDCFRNENRIVFFKQAVNRRRVTMITGLERYLEWVSLPKD